MDKLAGLSGGMSDAAKRRIDTEIEKEFEWLDELDPTASSGCFGGEGFARLGEASKWNAG